MIEKIQKPPYPLRMPDDLRQRLQAEADGIGRSLNAEIIARLEETFSLDAASPMQREFVKTMIKVVLEEIEQEKHPAKKSA